MRRVGLWVSKRGCWLRQITKMVLISSVASLMDLYNMVRDVMENSRWGSAKEVPCPYL